MLETKLLIIDDEEDIGFALSRSLQKDGHQVEFVLSGEEGLEYIRHIFYGEAAPTVFPSFG